MAKPSGRRTAQFKLPQGQPQPSVPSLENNFVAGLKTEFTGLNFPENACTATSNCVFNRIGNVTRRNGIDYESGFRQNIVSRANCAISTFVWTNVGGDGNTKLFVVQVGSILYFYQLTNATPVFPLSTTILATTINLSSFVVPGTVLYDITLECQFASGNGYLFVFHPQINPISCTFFAGVVTPSSIDIQIRDFTGVLETPPISDNTRPITQTLQHQYNLQNQGWTTGAPWGASSTTSNVLALGGATWTVAAGLSVTLGDSVQITATTSVSFPGRPNFTFTAGAGTVTAYSGTSLTINVTGITNDPGLAGQSFSIWSFAANASHIAAWQSAIGNFPSNADVWWTFKNASGVFAPATTIGNITLGSGPAPKGFYLLDAFNQTRTLASGTIGLTDVTTLRRPTTGSWFQGRVWYSGVNASFPAQGNASFSTWSENIYFSQIITSPTQFGRCYQTNDPTSETLFDILPSDGGVITIQDSGTIYKLYPVQNGLLVFAANGIWFITGSQGIGFSATDYTVTKIAGEHCISGTSFVDVQGYPMFWNNDGIYTIMPGVSQTSGQRSLEIKNLTLPSIKQFYQSIPMASKLFARGSYNHLTGVIQWVYRSTAETDVTSRYTFDSILNFLTYTEAFYNWTIAPGSTVLGATYIEPTNATPSATPDPVFKYLTYTNSGGFTFSEERDSVNWQDWNSSGSLSDYTSFFQTGYSLKGKGQRRFQPQYVYVFSEIPAYQYKIQGIWDYAATAASNRFSTEQVVVVNKPSSYFKDIRKVRIRGNGYVLQYQITSVQGKPFNISGWSVLDTIGIE